MHIPEQIIDAHHHLWDLQACHYPWLMTKGVKRFFGDPTAIQKNYLIDDLFNDIGDLPVSASVHVQVGVDESQSVDETRWLQSVADSAHGKGFPQAIVAFCDLTDENAIIKLQEHKQHSNLRSIRQIVGRSPDEDRQTSSRRLLDNSTWRDNLSQLAELDLSFDLQLIPEYISAAHEVLSDIPHTKIALCHCSSPFDQSKEGFRFWRRELRKLAELPNVFCKISGFGMFDHNWTVASIQPILETVIETFSPKRCMLGSNFPVDKLYTDYHTLWHAYIEITNDYSTDEKDSMFSHTAKSFYSIEIT